jgi:hypothetical protein
MIRLICLILPFVQIDDFRLRIDDSKTCLSIIDPQSSI